ncbi:MAG: hypothetical protein H6721_25235 [Sandaracinus sp.]|nr:hypothetical protein [Myxococcales bacterium]MCB9601173.1 hypothetical protein [Sandaracinus sp.]MCB9617941.1 hypothetical protein [Sandaracinus sp.]MCB9635437.1 hypothetical protein [Sandaracinus sp.]
MARLWGWVCLVAVLGCGDDDGGVDASSSDGGARDAGARADAGPRPDAGPVVGDGFFPPTVSWAQPVDDAPLDAQSDDVIAWLDAEGGWGNRGVFQIDFSIEVLEADADTPRESFEPTSDFYSPDCDEVPVPRPSGGRIEGEEGYECTLDGDCHLIVHDRGAGRLYEMWRANVSGGTFYGGCLAVWDTSRDYGDDGRGQGCTSADAAGLPIAPLLFTADEVASGTIDHAIRFILPNERIRRRVYVAPATHSTNPTSGGADAPPYGVRLRLRADYPLETLPNDAARTVARALQRYGMILADAGQIALTARSDHDTVAKWDGLLGPRDLQALEITDFEMIEAGPRTDWSGDCTRVE